MGKDDAPEGPNFKDLISKMNKFVSQNQDLFKEALSFGKDQFTNGQAFVDKLEQFGMDAKGRLGDQAKNFKKEAAARIGKLDTLGAKYGKGIDSTYQESKKLASDITGKLKPGMEDSAELGGTLLNRYTEQGIPFQDEYISKLKGWDTSNRREDRAAQAVNDISMASEAAREAELQKLGSYGIDPSQTRAASLDARLQVQNAIAKAQAANAQRQAVEAEGLTLGKTASDMYDQSMQAGRGMVESATQQAGAIADIARQPGMDWLANLGNLGQYGLGVGQLEQSAGGTGFNMNQAAEQFGQAGMNAATGQQNTVANYGSSVYDQARAYTGQSGSLTQGAYGTAGNLHQGDLATAEQNNKNSFGGALGTLAGLAIPMIPGIGPIASAGLGAVTAAASRPRSPTVPSSGTQVLYRGKGGAIPDSASPSRGRVKDDIPAKLDAGEYVVDRDTVRWFGEKHFANLQKKAKEGLGIPEAA